MRYGHPFAIAIGAIVLGAAVLSTSPSLAQQATKQEHKLTLRAIMQELGAEYLRLTNALLIDDFKGLEESAKAIQTHPLPDEIVVAIKNKLGRNFRSFEPMSKVTNERQISSNERQPKTSQAQQRLSAASWTAV